MKVCIMYRYACVWIHIYTHVRMFTYTDIYVHTNINACIHRHRLRYTYTYIYHSQRYSVIRRHALHMYTHVNVHTYVNVHTCSVCNITCAHLETTIADSAFWGPIFGQSWREFSKISSIHTVYHYTISYHQLKPHDFKPKKTHSCKKFSRR